MLSPAVFSYLEEGFSSIVYTGYTGLITNERLDYFKHDGLWLDIGTVASLRMASLRAVKAGVARRAAAVFGLEAAAIAAGAHIARGRTWRDSEVGAGWS